MPKQPSTKNILAVVNPELAAQWHPTLNDELTPDGVTAGSNKKVWWSCTAHSHAWKAEINSRSKGSGCPVCAGWKVLAGFNDLATRNPELASQWHPTLNGELTPSDVMAGVKDKVWWSCTAHAHAWKAAIDNRSKGSGCSVCSGKEILAGFNDLGTLNPELAAQWHPTLNGELTPADVVAGARDKVWWSCTTHPHVWNATINSRSQGKGCPECSTGKTEKAFRENFAKLSEVDFQTCKMPLIRISRVSDMAQIDMVNEELKLVIEYDSEWTHGVRNPEKKSLTEKLMQDQETTKALTTIGYNVVRIREQSNRGTLPFVPLDPDYEGKVFQITYVSHGKKKDSIEDIVRQVIEQKAEWFSKA